MKWELISNKKVKSADGVFKELLKNRKISTELEVDQFINPVHPKEIEIKELGIKQSSLKKIVERIKKAKDKKERIVIFGDYDCDGVCATAILWEALYSKGFDVLPYIPNRFDEGYGIKKETFNLEKFKALKPNLIICVDNGIVAYEAIKEAKNIGIDTIVVDHHTLGNDKLDTDYVFHSTLVCGSALSWFLVREFGYKEGLDLAALGTVSDQMQLVGINWSIVKYGLESLNKFKRLGILELSKNAGIQKIGTYEIGFVIAPRINAMGRLADAIDSLRLICTKDKTKAVTLAEKLSKTNIERQQVVDDVLSRGLQLITEEKVIVIDGDYHEGVIGLASGKVTEKYYRPSVILSRGDKVSKASARSIDGFNIIEAIKETNLILEGGGHPMAAGFSIYTDKIEEFKLKINQIADSKIVDEILEKKLKVDLELGLSLIDKSLIELIKRMEPFGYGNLVPTFLTNEVLIKAVKVVGSDGKHLKLTLEKGGHFFDAIAFGFGGNRITPGQKVDIVYSVEENSWSNKSVIQLKIKDIR